LSEVSQRAASDITNSAIVIHVATHLFVHFKH